MSQSKKELNALLKRISVEQDKRLNPEVHDESEVQPYDLGHQTPIIRGRMPGLEAVYDRFARIYAQSFSHHVRRPATITRRSTELVSFRDYLGAITTPASLSIFGMNPLQGHALFVFEHHLVHVLIDLLFGGNGWFENPPPKREFTGIEIRMLSKVVFSALEDLGKAWKRLTPLEPYFERMEVQPKFAAIVPQEEVVASTTFDVEINRVPYTMSICLPYLMLDPVRLQIEAGKTSFDEEVNAVNVSRLEENLRNSKVSVKVALGEARMSLRDFLTLKNGDRINLNQDQDKPLKVLVQDKLKYMATQGSYKGKHAVQITKMIEPQPRFKDLLDQPNEDLNENS
ncbi:MAG: flagellar motor switch protein FliM [Deltaproteobacteria bacterium]|jgi:flagellar motor switch protein FliM|nr:flagellar motor switch protein FliM [Deltaproteobacteria bacterium]MDG1177131.1 flagellar motor switch protein FliM [SAR324 cluster bacterium]RZO39860.1 MAG: flagellar motor switch protein FliM [Pseudomonadota bacterium]MDG1487509.1 flagellar motor switch protein FliM [SAR324 cluster bacterium]MDG2063703.1 flagellar motor switch protein FliM [SAR324 cluster bacterium]|tara:strand:- start:1157 stop:2182 length:1026 start_codon:yes stop_codon:yes gene_type:complete